MKLLNPIKNAFTAKVLRDLAGHVTNPLNGNKGSNILGAVLVAVLAVNIDYMKAIEGFKFEDPKASEESAKLVSAAIAGAFAWYVGKKDAPAK